MLSTDEKARYARHFSLSQVGLEGQEKLKQSSVLCIGAGGLGSPSTLYLAAAGVGRIGIVDPDCVEVSNLQRQILHGQSTLGKSKLDSAISRLRDINPHVIVEPHACTFTSENAIALASSYDIIIDGTDNFPTRYLSNDVAYFLKKPNIYASIFRFEGQLSVFAPHLGGPCYRCMLPTPPDPGTVPSCAEAGVLGVLPGIIGSLQAMEAIKLLLGAGEPPLGRLIHYDALQTKFREFNLRRDPECPLCGDHPTIKELIDYDDFCGIPKTSAATPVNDDPTAITVEELRDKLANPSGLLLIDVREPWEYDVAHIDGFHLMPLTTVPASCSELDEQARTQKIILLCKGGVRSARAQEFLAQQGITNTINVLGGMDAWLRSGFEASSR
ncbi:molybdopterin-synthase adenylyltransferase MoeB [Verrucomicrobiaceae bacterium N1E253]|uniref:Molybdopterin-synthase adenylyltransferase n=1 Tax=Oceaniferula marina TaxID=2748318 RepID=A0A851GH72_9BACT|nr:molybdopterin-synthase adenylyltransferase MoeB [Oceaniferula marina]NWK54595.1 molybdopterin-synthase adenylyltransferase MoeB [Oceaniferula marina]